MYHESNQQFRTSDAERRWAHIHNVDIKRLREVHLLIDELRTRLRQLNIIVPRDIETDQMQRRRNPFTHQQNLLNLKVRLFHSLFIDSKNSFLDYHRWSILSKLLYSRTD